MILNDDTSTNSNNYSSNVSSALINHCSQYINNLYPFLGRHSYKRSLNEFLESIPQTIYQCSSCSQQFEDKESFSIHVATHKGLMISF